MLLEDSESQHSPLSAFLLVAISIRGLILSLLVVLPFTRKGLFSLPDGLGVMDLVISLLSSFLGVVLGNEVRVEVG